MNFNFETPENYEQKTVCCFVVDTSGSMSGQKIDELNSGLSTFFREIASDTTVANRLEIAIVEFNSATNVIQQPSLVENCTIPQLQTSGSTALVDGVNAGIDLVRQRKQWYKSTGQPYLRPWIILLTDGEPDSNQDVNALISTIQKASSNKEFMFLPIGVDGANMDMLSKIAMPEVPALKLQGLNFMQFFKWLSASMTMISASKEGQKIELPSTKEWTSGFTI